WSYKNISVWEHESVYCKGKVQSPINLVFNSSTYDKRLKQMYFVDQGVSDPPILLNNGHTAQLNFNKHYVMYNIAPESEDFHVQQLHFHWGNYKDNVNGSEHLLEGQPYPLEVRR
ncbi:unnamed protein product, partial [Didymodactylos carnosus]